MNHNTESSKDFKRLNEILKNEKNERKMELESHIYRQLHFYKINYKKLSQYHLRVENNEFIWDIWPTTGKYIQKNKKSLKTAKKGYIKIEQKLKNLIK